MSKFDLMANDVRMTVAKYDVYCQRFEFHSDHYTCYKNGSEFIIEGNDGHSRPNVAHFYDITDLPRCGDSVLIDGIKNYFIIKRITKYGPGVNPGLTLEINGGMQNSG